MLDSVIDHGCDLEVARARMHELLALVRLDPARTIPAYPHQLSGGMRQRALLVMAMIMQPELLILDEPTTALDLITQAYIFDIFEEVHRACNQTMLFITHDLAAVARLAQRVGVLYGGKLVETGTVEDLFERPQHPYTQTLLAAIPSIHGPPPSVPVETGSPSATVPPVEGLDRMKRPTGCIFAHRCKEVEALCREQSPPMRWVGGQEVACHHRPGAPS